MREVSAVVKSPTRPVKASAGDPEIPEEAGVGKVNTQENKGKLSVLLEWSKPYRELIAILVALVISISGSVAWIVAHFATQAQVHYLECRVTNNILTQLLPIHMEEYADKIEWRSAQIKELAQHGGGTPQSINTIADLSDQMTSLTKAQQAAATAFQKDIDDIAKRCISESPQTEKGPSS